MQLELGRLQSLQERLREDVGDSGDRRPRTGPDRFVDANLAILRNQPSLSLSVPRRSRLSRSYAQTNGRIPIARLLAPRISPQPIPDVDAARLRLPDSRR